MPGIIPKPSFRNRFTALCAAGAALIALLQAVAPAGTSAAAGVPLVAASKDLTEMNIEDLLNVSVISASKYEQKATEAPSAVSVVTGDEIRKYGHRTLADVLRSLRSFYISNDRNYDFIGVRGFSPPGDYNTRLLLLVDGHRINDGIYDTAAVGTDFILDVDLIDRVEVIRGPSSSLYGSNAFFGVINVITRRGKGLNGIEASGEAGSHGALKGRATYGNRYPSGLEVILSGTAFRRKGEDLFFPAFNDPSTNNGIAEKKDGDRFKSLFSTLSWHDLTLQGAYIRREKEIPTGAWTTAFNDPRNRSIDDRYYADLSYDRSIDEKTTASGRIFLDGYRYRGSYAYIDDTVNPDPPYDYVNRDDSVARWWGVEAKLIRRMFATHRLIAGVEYRDYFKQNQRNDDAEPFAANWLDDSRKTRILAVYFQDEFEIAKGLILNAGLRHDRYSTFGGTTNPRVALIWNPRPKTTLKLLYGTAFRSPNVYEMYYADGITGLANPNLRPEKIRTYEAVMENAVGENLRLLVAGYHYRIKGLITQETDATDPLNPMLIFRNVESVRADGLETALDGRWANGFAGRASYTYQRSRDAEGRKLPNSPRHLAKLNLIAPLLAEKVFAGGEFQYVSKRISLQDETAKAYGIVNLTVWARNLVKGLDGSVGAYNLFDDRHGDPTGNTDFLVPQDGRSYRAKLTYRF